MRLHLYTSLTNKHPRFQCYKSVTNKHTRFQCYTSVTNKNTRFQCYTCVTFCKSQIARKNFFFLFLKKDSAYLNVFHRKKNKKMLFFKHDEQKGLNYILI
jgi:hypothetical protein